MSRRDIVNLDRELARLRLGERTKRAFASHERARGVALLDAAFPSRSKVFHVGDYVKAGHSPHIGRIIAVETVMDRYTVHFPKPGGTDIFGFADLRHAPRLR